MCVCVGAAALAPPRLLPLLALSVGSLPCMKMPVRSSCTWKPMYTLARLMLQASERECVRVRERVRQMSVGVQVCEL